VGQPVRFANLQEATEYLRAIAPGFALGSDEQWRELAANSVRPQGDGLVLHYDPAIGLPLRVLTAEAVAAGEQLLWERYDAIAAPTLLVRGERSDLLSAEAAQQMQQRGPRPACVVVPGVGHAPMFFDAPQIAIVRDFLRAA
jgi:pimeloyl-ACP methyl ester carboxylesterase